MTAEIILYQMPDGTSTLDVTVQGETIWLSLNQMSALFERDKSVISRHLKNVFETNELNRKAVVAFFATTAVDGKEYQVEYFNLDAILSVGYRVNSKQGTIFRQWASQLLKDHTLKGYTINRNRIKENYSQFLDAVAQVKNLLSPGTSIDHESIFELITLFADTWLSLDAYDKDKLTSIGTTKKKVELTAKDLGLALIELKQILITKGEATDLFGRERTIDSLSGIVGNVLQSFANEELYPSIEEKACNT